MTKAPPTRRPSKTVESRPVIALANLDEPELANLTPMNFRVPRAFHREFKIYAAQNGMTMGDLLQESFHVFKAHQKR